MQRPGHYMTVSGPPSVFIQISTPLGLNLGSPPFLVFLARRDQKFLHGTSNTPEDAQSPTPAEKNLADTVRSAQQHQVCQKVTQTATKYSRKQMHLQTNSPRTVLVLNATAQSTVRAKKESYQGLHMPLQRTCREHPSTQTAKKSIFKSYQYCATKQDPAKAQNTAPANENMPCTVPAGGSANQESYQGLHMPPRSSLYPSTTTAKKSMLEKLRVQSEARY